jgi:hypothetical protein
MFTTLPNKLEVIKFPEPCVSGAPRWCAFLPYRPLLTCMATLRNGPAPRIEHVQRQWHEHGRHLKITLAVGLERVPPLERMYLLPTIVVSRRAAPPA